MALRFSNIRRHARLSPLSPRPSRPHAAGERSRPCALGTVSHYQGELPPQVLARHHWSDRIPAAEGADPECARRSDVAGCGARAPFLEETWTSSGRQRLAASWNVAGWRVV